MTQTINWIVEVAPPTLSNIIRRQQRMERQNATIS
jgi:hypothetical protein